MARTPATFSRISRFRGCRRRRSTSRSKCSHYLELQPGLYRMGVNSDDNFRVSPATRVNDPNNAITIGTFDGGGGRAQGDTFFEFQVAEAGLYPFRLVFEQGAGGWGLEWFIQSMVIAATRW